MRALTAFFLSFFILLSQGVSAEEANATSESERIIFTKPQMLPQTLYVNQVIEVSVDTIIAQDIFDTIESDFGQHYGIEILTKHPTWYLKEQNTFSLTYYIKVLEPYIKIPDLAIRVTLGGEILDTGIEPGNTIRAKTIQPNNQFCQVVAEDLVVTNSKIDKYDDDLNIFVLEMESFLGNLEDFSLPFVREEGIDWSQTEFPKTKIFYYGIIPNNMEQLEFNYFKPGTGEFKKKSITFDFSKFGQKTSTQIEINPNKKNFPYLRLMMLASLVLLFILVYLWRKKYIYLILAGLVALYTLYTLRDRTISIKPDTQVYLLPTKNSSIFFTTGAVMRTELIKKRDGYYKVLLPDDKIGWIKEEDVYKD